MYDDLKVFIEHKSGTAFDFGSANETPLQGAISAAENLIGATFPPSYRWFLENYGGGYIFGDEIYSVINNPSPEIYQGDVAALTVRFRAEGVIPDTDIALCSTDFGEMFSMDASQPDERGEYKVYRTIGDERTEYAKDFAQFIVKFVKEAETR